MLDTLPKPRILAVQIADTRVIALTRHGPEQWKVHVDNGKTYVVDDTILMDPFRMDAVCKLNLSFHYRGTYLRSLLAAFRRAGVSLTITKSMGAAA